MNNSVLKNDPKNDASKTNPVLPKNRKASRCKALFGQAARLIDFFRTWISEYFNRQDELHTNAVESVSSEDKIAILKTQCDYVRSCYRVKILERQQALNNVPKNLDTEIDELLDSYQRLKRAYEQLERED
jgi:hypothetical protein